MQTFSFRLCSLVVLLAASAGCIASAGEDLNDSSFDVGNADSASPAELAEAVLNDDLTLPIRLQAFRNLRTASPLLFGEILDDLSTRPEVIEDSLALFSVSPDSPGAIERLAAYQSGDPQAWRRLRAAATPMSDALAAWLDVVQEYSVMPLVHQGWKLLDADVPDAVAIATRARDAFYGGSPAPWTVTRERVFFDEVFDSAFKAQEGSELRAFQRDLAINELQLLLSRRGSQVQPFQPQTFDWSIDSRISHYCGQVSALVTPSTTQGLDGLLVYPHDYLLIERCRSLFFEIIRATPMATIPQAFEMTISRYRDYRNRGFSSQTEYLDASAVLLVQKALAVPASERAHVFDAMLQYHVNRYRNLDWDGQSLHTLCFNRIRDVLAILPGLTPAQATAISLGMQQVPRLPGITPQWPL